MSAIRLILTGFVFVLLSACGGGGGGGSPSAPIISGLTYSPTSTTASLSSFTVSGSVTISTSFDLATLKIVDSRGNTITNPITGASGFRSGTVKVPAATVAGNPAGLYSFTVSVIDVNGTESNKLTGQIDIKRVPLVADAGLDISMQPNQTVTIQGASSNVNGTPTNYSWAVLNKSTGSVGQLSNQNSQSAQFSSSTQGKFEIGLTISDGSDTSPIDSIIVTSLSNDKFSIGTPLAQLISVQGAPVEISTIGNISKYSYDQLGLTYVQIGSTCKCVVGWRNYNGSLKSTFIIGWDTDGQPKISLNSYIDDVIRIQGIPIEFDNSAPERTVINVNYDRIRLTFDTLGLTYVDISPVKPYKVIGWRNYNGSLILQ